MSRQLHYSTPKKIRIRGTIAFLEAHGIPHFKNDVFRFHGASRRAGWRALAESGDLDARTFHSTYLETRGRKKKLSNEDLAVIEQFIDNNGFDGCTIP